MQIKIFCSYAPQDTQYLKVLLKHLVPLQYEGVIDVWSALDIRPGTEWRREMRRYLEEAQIILLLVSPDFLNSENCYSEEMQRALDRHAYGEAKVIPIILKPVMWEYAPFGKLKALPRNASYVTQSKNLEDAMYEVAKEIQKDVEVYLASVARGPVFSNPPLTSSNNSQTARSEKTPGAQKMFARMRDKVSSLPWSRSNLVQTYVSHTTNKGSSDQAHVRQYVTRSGRKEVTLQRQLFFDRVVRAQPQEFAYRREYQAQARKSEHKSTIKALKRRISCVVIALIALVILFLICLIASEFLPFLIHLI